MPAVSMKQRRMMAIAEHQPEKLHKRNRAVMAMSQGQMHDFAATSEKGLPKQKKKSSLKSRMIGEHS